MKTPFKILSIIILFVLLSCDKERPQRHVYNFDTLDISCLNVDSLIVTNGAKTIVKHPENGNVECSITLNMNKPITATGYMRKGYSEIIILVDNLYIRAWRDKEESNVVFLGDEWFKE